MRNSRYVYLAISPQITVSPTIETNTSLDFNLSHNIALIQRELNEIKKQLASEKAKEIQEIQDSLKELEKRNLPEDVKASSSISGLRKFLEELPYSRIGKTISEIKDGVKIVQKLAEYYNGIASWCGLPQVPKPFLLKKP